MVRRMTFDDTWQATSPPRPLVVELSLTLSDELGGIWMTDALMLTVPRVGERVGHGPAIFDVLDVIHYTVSKDERRSARLQVAAPNNGISGPNLRYPWWLPEYGWRRLMEGLVPWEPSG